MLEGIRYGSIQNPGMLPENNAYFQNVVHGMDEAYIEADYTRFHPLVASFTGGWCTLLDETRPGENAWETVIDEVNRTLEDREAEFESLTFKASHRQKSGADYVLLQGVPGSYHTGYPNYRITFEEV